MVDNEYNSIVGQNRVKNYLAGLHVRHYVSKEFDYTEAPSKLYK